MPRRLYPFGLAIYPVFHLAAANAGEWIQLSDLLVPLGASLAATAVAWLAAATLTHDPDKRAVLAAVGGAVFASYGFLAEWVFRLGFARLLGPPATTLTLLAMLVTVIVLRVRRSPRIYARATRYLSIAALTLVVLPVAQILWVRARAPLSHVPAVHADTVAYAGARPTIYIIVLDKYEGTESLRSYYGFDNTPVERALQARGFVIPRHPRANYTYTRPAMASLLNWQYLDTIAARMGPASRDWTPIFRLAEDNRAIAFLRGLGYEIVYFPNAFEPFRRNRNADLQLPDPAHLRSEFETSWQATTLLVPLVAAVCPWLRCDTDPWAPEATSAVDWKWAQLGPLAATTRPRFILAHFLVPHEPYVYRADCTHAPTRAFWPDSSLMRRAYLDQITCVNRKLLAAVDAIRRASPTPPVILVVGDHGNAHFPKEPLPLREATPAMIHARLDVFAAFLVPDPPDTLFYDGMTLVNLLPRVFNHLFGATFPRLPDRSVWAVSDAPYDLTPLAPVVPAARR
jgi:hypothetical protein